MDEILVRVRTEIEAAKAERSRDQLAAMIDNTPEIRSLSGSLGDEFGLIAEIKVRAPSRGEMRAENVEQAPMAYDRSHVVKAISVLTNRADFGMSIERLREIKLQTCKPVLRKEFIIDPYQIWEARAFGADAVLLMTQKASTDELQRLHDLAYELGMEVLIESRTEAELLKVPADAVILGINTRDMLAPSDLYKQSRTCAAQSGRDLSTDMKTLENIRYLPENVIRVAESGIDPSTICKVRDLGYNAALIGSDILLNEDGVDSALGLYEKALGNDEGPTGIAH
jgi:indole-3-glycerol phosphate synthase